MEELLGLLVRGGVEGGDALEFCVGGRAEGFEGRFACERVYV